jgi:translin
MPLPFSFFTTSSCMPKERQPRMERIKRLVYDRMRPGRGKDAEKLFATMEEIYNAIYPFALDDNIVSGLRRKLDVARMLIEDIRATVTEESRRKALIEAVQGFENSMPKEK